MYIGSASELTAAGIVRPEQLPGVEGLPPTGVTFYDGKMVSRYQRCKHDEKHLNIVRRGRGFLVRIGVTAQVRVEREAIEKRQTEIWSLQYEAQDAAERAKAVSDREIRLKKELAECALHVIPQSAGDYQSGLIDDWHRHAIHMRDSISPDMTRYKIGDYEIDSFGCGFSLDESDMIEFDALVDEMKELLTNAKVRFNAQKQKQTIANCQIAIAKGDDKFQRVLARLI